MVRWPTPPVAPITRRASSRYGAARWTVCSCDSSAVTRTEHSCSRWVTRSEVLNVGSTWCTAKDTVCKGGTQLRLSYSALGRRNVAIGDNLGARIGVNDRTGTSSSIYISIELEHTLNQSNQGGPLVARYLSYKGRLLGIKILTLPRHHGWLQRSTSPAHIAVESASQSSAAGGPLGDCNAIHGLQASCRYG